MKDKFLQGLKEGNASHAYLITGNDAFQAAMQAAEILLCIGDKKPCGICNGCIQLKAKSNMDFLYISDEKLIKVDAVRGIEEFISTLSRNGAKKVVIIEDAHKMNPSAQNALLKTLEEPPADSVLILAGNPSGLLPTVLSRCSLIRCLNAYDGGDKEKALMLLKKLLSDDKSLHQDFIEQKANIQELIECQMELLLQAFHIKEHGTGCFEAQELCYLHQASILSIIDLLLDAKKRLKANANLGLVVDRLLILTAATITK